MSLDGSKVFSAATSGVKKINGGITKATYDYYKTIDKICVLTVDGTMYIVKTNATNCKDCWQEMNRDGFLSVMVDSSKGEDEHLIHASLVREMFLGTKPLR